MGREWRTTRTAAARRRLARWLDPSVPTVVPAPPALPAGPAASVGSAPLPGPIAPFPGVPLSWPDVLENMSLRVLSAVYQASGQLASLESTERDGSRLDRLYRVDHAITRVRRHAENMQVLAGRPVEDADRQVTTMVDVVRAALSAIEHYPRVRLGRVVDLSVVEFAADDVMRVLTELIDNAARFSPPGVVVTVSAHLTEQGSVLIRVEDGGVGIAPAELHRLNALVSGAAPPAPGGERMTRLGLAVVARLAAAHRLRVALISRQPAGTTATVLLPAELLCEGTEPAPDLEQYADGPGAAQPVVTATPGADDGWPQLPEPGAGTTTRPAHLVPVHSRTGTGLIAAESTLPRRVRASLRDGTPQPPPPADVAGPVVDRAPWHDDVAAFAAGAGDAHTSTGRHDEGRA